MAVRTLIVDDSPVARRVLKHRFESKGFEVVGEAANATEGLEMFRSLQPQLVTMDLLMPTVDEVDSKSLFQSIRKEGPEVAVVVISAQPKTTERAEYVRKGAVAYFEKPLNFEALFAKLNQIFR
jgi:two-component system, chemotaxis family, chemotaxis protein CheY